jgi:nucleoside-triphosphatase
VLQYYKQLSESQQSKDQDSGKFLLTGPPECGKTTIILKLAEMLATIPDDIALTGFSAREIRFGVVRQGFEITPLGDACEFAKPWILAHMQYGDSPYKVSKYGVDVATLDEFIPKCFKFSDKSQDKIKVVLIDEIGMMECYSEVFQQEVEKVLNDPDLFVIAAVGQRGNPFMDKVRQRDDVKLFTLLSIVDAVREDIPQQIFYEIANFEEEGEEEAPQQEKSTEVASETEMSKEDTGERQKTEETRESSTERKGSESPTKCSIPPPTQTLPLTSVPPLRPQPQPKSELLSAVQQQSLPQEFGQMRLQGQ